MCLQSLKDSGHRPSSASLISGAPHENIDQNSLNIALLNVVFKRSI